MPIELFDIFRQSYGLEHLHIGRGRFYLVVHADVLVHFERPIVEKLANCWPFSGRLFETFSDDFCEFIGVDLGDGMVGPSHDVLMKVAHAVSREGRSEGGHLIENTAQGPDVRFVIIRFILPDLWTGIVRCAGLCLNHSMFIDLRHIHISYLVDLLAHEDVFAFEISMQNLISMENLQAMQKMDHEFPDVELGHQSFLLLGEGDLLAEIAVAGVLHDDAEAVDVLVEEGLVVFDYIRGLQGG
jgi:hypothetical protein